MKYNVVIFDLFDTLTENFPLREYKDVLSEMASTLSVPADEFVQLWWDTAHERMVGKLPTTEATVRYVVKTLGMKASTDSIARAVEKRVDFTRRALNPRSGALETLHRLKAMDRKIGLVSDCTAEVPALWDGTPFACLVDVPVFSCSEGLKKPDIRIYQLVCKRLGVAVQDCLYVGDGASCELNGARKAGLHPVLLRVSSEEGATYRSGIEEWEGPTISYLREVLSLME